MCVFVTYKLLGSEVRHVTETRVVELFNRLSHSETRVEATCTYCLFQMQQTHKFVSLLMELTVDISETSTAGKLSTSQAEVIDGTLQRQSSGLA